MSAQHNTAQIVQIISYSDVKVQYLHFLQNTIGERSATDVRMFSTLEKAMQLTCIKLEKYSKTLCDKKLISNH